MNPRSSHTARFVAGAADPAHLPRLRHPEVAFAGRSNVGKSSLLNRLTGHHSLARVSKTPGRTQQINFFVVDDRMTFVDLPGYGFARVPLTVKDQWKRLVETYLTERRNLRAVVVIVDLRRGVEEEDATLLDYLHSRGIPVILVATKADKLAYGARLQRARELVHGQANDAVSVVVCSAVSGDGINDLWEQIRAQAGAGREGRPV